MTDDELQPGLQESSMNIVNILIEIINDIQRRLRTIEGLPQDAIEIKTTTGDYTVANSWDGRRVLNTFDNNYKIFAEGAWRQIIAY